MVCLDPGQPAVDLATETPEAASSSAKLTDAGSGFASVGTRPAFASLTIDSEPPMDAGSYRTQVATVRP